MTTFSWNNFNADFIDSVVYSPKTTDEFRPDVESHEKDILISFISSICNYPDDRFIRKYRDEIENRLLRNYPDAVKEISKVFKLIGTNYLGHLKQLSLMPLTASLIKAYLFALVKIGGLDITFTPYSVFTSTVNIDMKTSIADEIPLFDYQKEAVDDLYKHFITRDQKSGMLVMPTGSGKTRTAVYFILKKMVSQGYQVIWLTHRYMLIDQTAQGFYEFASLAKIENPEMDTFKMVCVSGQHQSIRATEKDDNVMILSIQSVFRNLDFIKSVLQKKILIVVDEAHHTLGRSYQLTINKIRKYRKDAKLLGLTATPVRATENGSRQLLNLFNNNIVYDISMSDLIVKGILATPEFTRIETNENFEPVISIDEKKFINKYGELPETLVNKIASSCTRNNMITSHYMQNRDKYGKTLIFALNIPHCIFLCNDLQNLGIKCDYIYSGLQDNHEKIRRFKDGELDVLININIMTEGSDVPDIETVFLTRPTQSEGLLMQMIGRGMRGKAAKGTEKVNIVDFCDKWDVFNKWLNPQWLVGAEIYVPKYESRTGGMKQYNKYSWELCNAIYDSITFSNAKGEALVSLPVCWYALIDEDGNDYRMLVFEDQLKGFIAMLKDKKSIIANEQIDIEKERNKYFGGFVLQPTLRDLELFIDNIKNDDDPPQRFILENRKSIDPAYLSVIIRDQGLNPLELATKVYNENPMVQNIYGSQNNYLMKVCEHAIYQNGIPPLGIRIEEMPVELIPFSMVPIYDLNELVTEVKNEMFGGNYENISSVTWTDKPYKTYYGMFYYSDNHIKINCVLNSPDVPREAVKYVIYHELLHRDNCRHDSRFRAEEHKYPDYTEQERFLLSQMNNFDIKEW